MYLTREKTIPPLPPPSLTPKVHHSPTCGTSPRVAWGLGPLAGSLLITKIAYYFIRGEGRSYPQMKGPPGHSSRPAAGSVKPRSRQVPPSAPRYNVSGSATGPPSCGGSATLTVPARQALVRLRPPRMHPSRRAERQRSANRPLWLRGVDPLVWSA